ncbi:hypothetical protein [Dictyobacter aurantiacus]|uniref:Uncharacterized protein n=1 Tax=Dictyobacter aurantiacus TaxID=1936993 RepID=A0A401ZMM3_9CHLR|nr:hypothetical protein [Dictyobacter aurantiacus]GCE08127.1 hypothetical protein KDAU_54560 [Dictyobacter aurantiacus]
MIMCPYCLTMQEPQQTNLCNNADCGEKLPPKYVECARNGNVMCLGTFGLPSHGKTALLSSLMQSAQGVAKIALGSYVRPLDDATQKKLAEWSARYKSGNVKLPATQPSTQPKPLLIMNNKFLIANSTTMVAYDLAGEVLDKAGSQPEYVRALHQVNTIWCVVSLDDLVNKNEAGYSLDSLFTIYLDAMSELHIPIRDKNILVVYTKADILLGMRPGLEPLPFDVVDYLSADPYDQLREKRGSELPALDEDAYFAKMCEISDILRDYTIEFVDGGGAFVNMVQDAGAQVYFTINSAYGSNMDASDTVLNIQVRAIRVLDALIWAIKLDRPRAAEQEVALIVPATIGSTGLASQETIVRFYDELSAHGGYVATYYPGQIEPAFPLGISPQGIQSSYHLALIGPILDNLKPGTAVVLLVNDTLPLDFVDLFSTHWMERVLLVVARRELVATWLPHRRIFTHSGEIAPAASAFLEHVMAGTKKP